MIHTCCDWGCMNNAALQNCVKYFHHSFDSFTWGFKLSCDQTIPRGTKIKLVNYANANERQFIASVRSFIMIRVVVSPVCYGFVYYHVYWNYEKRRLCCFLLSFKAYQCFLPCMTTWAWPPITCSCWKDKNGCLMWRTASHCTVNHCTVPRLSSKHSSPICIHL